MAEAYEQQVLQFCKGPQEEEKAVQLQGQNLMPVPSSGFVSSSKLSCL